MDLQALRVPIIQLLASVWRLAHRAASPGDAAALAPTRNGYTSLGRRGRSPGGGRGDRGAGRGGAGAARGSRHSSRRRGGGRVAGDAEPFHVVGAVDGDVVGDAAAVDADEVRTVDILGVRRRRRVGEGLLRLAVSVAEDAGPLLQSLVEVLRRLSVIGGPIACFLEA